MGSRSRLIHLLVLHAADFLLRLGRLFHLRVEQDEVFVLRFGLRKPVRPALAVPAIGKASLALARYSLVS